MNAYNAKRYRIYLSPFSFRGYSFLIISRRDSQIREKIERSHRSHISHKKDELTRRMTNEFFFLDFTKKKAIKFSFQTFRAFSNVKY